MQHRPAKRQHFQYVRKIQSHCLALLMTITAVTGTLATMTVAADPEPDMAIQEIIVFGDSLSDTGNVFLFTGFPPSPVQIPASPQWFAGRFTNGPVWHEILAEGLGVTPASASLLGGNNYAWGGAEGGAGFAAASGVPNVGTQISDYLSGKEPTADQLFIIQAGNNDFIPPGEPVDPAALVADMVGHVTRLSSFGARQFMVLTSDIQSHTPGLNPPLDEALFGMAPERGAIDDVLDRVKRYNRMLRKAMMEIERELSDETMTVSITLVNTSLTGRVVLQIPGRFGLDNVTTPALTSFFNPLCFCEGVVADDADRYFYFDIVHPSATVHELYGELALKSLLSRGGPPLLPPGLNN